jgi:hypothetical protein
MAISITRFRDTSAFRPTFPLSELSHSLPKWAGSHFARERLTAFTPWHPDAASGSHPPKAI